MNKTETMVQEMLTENTGSHFLDSGGAYGRHWEKNQGRDFEKEPWATVEFDEKYIDYTKSLFHFIVDNLDYEEKWDKVFNEKYAAKADPDASWLQLAEEFADWLKKQGYSVGQVTTCNTYNHESALSQVIQYTVIDDVPEDPDNPGGDDVCTTTLVLLEIHNGCDVRGGYTKPRVFSLGADEMFYFDADGDLFCDNCDANWRTDDTYHWYNDGSTAGKQLETYEFVDGRAILGTLLGNYFESLFINPNQNKIFADISGTNKRELPIGVRKKLAKLNDEHEDTLMGLNVFDRKIDIFVDDNKEAVKLVVNNFKTWFIPIKTLIESFFIPDGEHLLTYDKKALCPICGKGFIKA